MSTEVMRTAPRAVPLQKRPTRQLRLEHVVMGGAIAALIVLVVLPLLFLLIGSLKGEGGLSLGHFSEVLSGRLYINALENSLILGAWTGLFSLVIGLVLAWAVSRTDVPAIRFIQATATLSYLLPPFLTAIAFTYLFSPNAGLINVLMRDVLGLPWLTFNIFTMTGLVIVTVVHTFPFVYLLTASALQSVDASYEEAAQILGAGGLRTAFSITAPLVAPAVLSGTLLAFVNAIALFGSQAIIGLPGRIVTLPTRIYALFDYRVTQRAIATSLLLATVAATLAVLLGTVMGWIDLRTRIPGRKILDYASLIPLGLPGIVVAVALIQFWLAMPIALYGTLTILLLAYVGRYIPLGVRAANASLRQVDPSLEESAQILGASWTTTMHEITLPLIRPGLFAGWLLVFVPVIQELSASILLFSSSSITLAVAIYNLYETGYIEPVAALAMINVTIIGAAIFVANKLGDGKIASRSGATQGLAA